MLLKAVGHASEGGSGRQSRIGAETHSIGEITVELVTATHQFAASKANLIPVLLLNYCLSANRSFQSL